MIGYLRGEILDASPGKVLLGLTTPSSESMVGYSVSLPHGTAPYDRLMKGQTAEFFIYTHVREDVLELFGFSTAQEKAFFLLLISVSGVGPRSALGVLSAAPVSVLIQSICSGDLRALVKLPGIGKKTAERMVLELKDTIKKQFPVVEVLGRDSSSLRSSFSVDENASAQTGLDLQIRDARSALLGLGYRENQIDPIIHRSLSEFTSPEKVQAEDIVKQVLRQI